MKNTLTRTRLWLMAFCLTFSTLILEAQNAGNHVAEWLKNQPVSFQETPLLQLSTAVQNRDNAPENATFLEIDPAILRGINESVPDAIKMTIPTADGNDFELTLARTEIHAADFKVTLNDGRELATDLPKGIFYRGIVNGDENSVASVSVFGNDIQAMIATSGDNFFIEKNGADSEEFILFNKKDAPNLNAVDCESLEVPNGAGDQNAGDRGVGCKVVQVYFECDYQMFLDKGSNTANVTSYVNGLFSQIATLYANENIAVVISQINVWTTADPYVSLTSTSAVLNSFLSTKGPNFTGNLAHFLTTRNLGGGIAYVGVLCNKSYAFGVSQVYNTYSNVPAYSWSVEVVTHELGHNFGAWHTHSCNWPGGPIDNCYTQEGTCAAGPAPTNGGTIMSYCHLTGVGINFANGFGTVPGNHIRSQVLNSACLSQSGTAPMTFSTANLTASGVTLNWGTVAGAVNYSVQYKLATATTWVNVGTVTTNSVALTGLGAATNYQWQVKTDCSAWSATQNFTTGGVSTACSAPAGLTTTAITTNTATLVWNPIAGATSYMLQYKTSSATTWTTSANLTGTTFNLTGLSAATTYNWLIKANCSINSAQVNFTTSTAPVTNCSKPTGMNTTAILTTSATLAWAAVPGATSYTVKFKLKSANTYTTLPAVTTTTRVLTGLTKGKQYNWQVKANCSSYTSTQNFTTPSQLIIGNDGTPMPSDKTLILSPNPIGSAGDELTIRYFQAPPEGAKMLLCDAAGRILRQTEFTQETMRVPAAELPYGIYTILLVENGHRLAAQRFVRIE